MSATETPEERIDFCDMGKFTQFVLYFWVLTLGAATAICAGFVFLVGILMQAGGFHSP